MAGAPPSGRWRRASSSPVIVIATLVPRDAPDADAPDFRRDLKALMRRPVLLVLLTTVLGYAGLFAVFTYIVPLPTEVTGMPEAAVSPILFVFGGGLIVGNLLGGRLADRRLVPTMLGSMLLLAAVLLGTGPALQSPITAVIAIGLLGPPPSPPWRRCRCG